MTSSETSRDIIERILPLPVPFTCACGVRVEPKADSNPFAKLCGTCEAAEQVRREARELHDMKMHRDRALEPAAQTVPRRFRWARWNAPELPERICGGLATVRALRDVRLDAGILVLRGATARGKTSLACAMLHAVIDAGRPLEANPRAVSVAAEARFVPAAYLVPGEVGDYWVSIARDASLLVLDDLGTEVHGCPPGSAMAGMRAERARLVLAHRYDEELPTIITTFLDYNDVDRAYGSSIAGRMFSDARGARLADLGG